MTPETRAALERRRAYKSKPISDRTVTDEFRAAKDALTLADAFLFLHPADDDEPATVEWFVEAGAQQFSGHDAPLGARLSVGPWSIDVWHYHGDILLELEETTVHPNPTRGQVRRLVEALGGAMKDAT